MFRILAFVIAFSLLAVGCEKQTESHSVDYWCSHKKDAMALLKTQCTGNDNLDGSDCATAQKAMMVCPNDAPPPRF